MNPATGERQLALIGEGQEIEMGREASRSVEASIGLYRDAELQAYVGEVGGRLAGISERPELPWSFEVVDDPVVNAFALPGGFLYLTRGIMAHFNSEAEMAAVLGHEIGHVTARHSVEQISRSQLFGLGLGVSSIFFEPMRGILGDVVGAGLGLLTLEYSRDDERQADALGVRYMWKQNWDPRASIQVHQTLARLREEGEGGGLPTWLSTHPSPEDRIERLREQIDTLDQSALSRATEGRDEYLRRLDGLVYGPNPRNGFFRADNTFQHPDLEFQMRFPEGWETRNLAQAVAALSPRQDAMIQLTLAEEGSHGAAADAFFGQPAIRSGRVSRDRINGHPATVGTFQVDTREGTLEGLAVFLDFGGHTFRLLGYTPSGRFRSYENTFRSSFGSFDRLRDRAALEVQPMRIDLLRVDGPTTIARLAESRRSPIPASRLAILNALEPEERIEAGTTIKWVVGEPPPGQ